MYMIAELSQYVAVASFLEAWIEMLDFGFFEFRDSCRLLLGGVDWNCFLDGMPIEEVRRLLFGDVDWNGYTLDLGDLGNSRLLLGGVDWNSYNSVKYFHKKEKDG